jgi:hypothetical protein
MAINCDPALGAIFCLWQVVMTTATARISELIAALVAEFCVDAIAVITAAALLAIHFPIIHRRVWDLTCPLVML